MNKFINPIQCLTAALLVVGLAPVSGAEAATVFRNYSQNGGSACTGALPTYEGALRKRPKAIANEGTTTAFITCSALHDGGGPTPVAVNAWFTNRGTAAATVNCSMVDGNDLSGSTTFPLSKVFAPGLFDGILWLPPVGGFRRSVSLSCALPPGVELNFFGRGVEEEVGN